MDNLTKYFNNCKGVFQGGGCKAIAYIGAYREAYERGVNFSEVAGTSAGSIIAVLIAAGASPDKLESIVSKIDFRQFEKNPTSSGAYKGGSVLVKIASSLLLLLGEIGRMVRNFLLYLGYRDSGTIESFIEKELSGLLGIKKDTILFSDLKMPVSVISSDLKNSNVKVWSQEFTPNDSVAYAVRCSCSIPLFFQPVDGRYVDGGMLSNLPTFVFSSALNYDKILAFSFSTPKNQSTGAISIGDYLSSLANTIVDGAKDIQDKLNPKYYSINIEVTGLSTTDFELLQEKPEVQTSVIAQGAVAMKEFLDRENLFMESYGDTNTDCFYDLSQMSTQIAFNSIDKNDKVIVADNHTRWSWDLFLTLIKWKMDGSEICIYTLKEITSGYREEEESRRRMFSHLGIELHLVDSLPVNGYFFKRNGSWKAVVFSRKNRGGKFLAKYFYNRIDDILIEGIVAKLSESPYTANPVIELNRITINREEDKMMLEKLRSVPFYRDSNIYFKRVKVSELLFTSQYLIGHKYRQIDVLYKLYAKSGIEPFASASIPLANGKNSMISPIVAEMHNGKTYVISGDTRCFYAYRHCIDELLIVVVEGVQERLPSNRSYHIDEMLFTDRDTEDTEHYEGFEHHLYRNIEQALRPDKDYLKD